MATTYKLAHSALTDGAIFIDLPISGRITQINFAGKFTSGAGGIGYCFAEISRVAVNQTLVNNPRGVIGVCALTANAISQNGVVNHSIFPDEPVKSGERLYLNMAEGANAATIVMTVSITIA